jgi:UDP-N-acetyl-D-mannosaminuronic acid dehydrogenase
VTELRNGEQLTFESDVVVMGGCGRAGLPLGMAFAQRGLKVALFDINDAAVERVSSGVMPFKERGADGLLPELLSDGSLSATTDPGSISTAENVVVVVGTPVDRFLSPDINAVPSAIEPLADRFTDGQLLVLRSTVYPGVTERVEQMLTREGRSVDVCFCPERIAEGNALDELGSLPQIVAARDSRVMERAASLFRHLVADIVELSPEEAELAKLFTNTWRYIKFAIANQLFMIANDSGLDFERIRHAITYNYPRAADMPGPGFAAGPCLFKDTMQIAAFSENNFSLGHASVMINEGLPLYVIGRLQQRFDLPAMTVGILGMAFKGGSDDKRDSLSYKLKRLLKMKARRVICSDPYIKEDLDLVPVDEVLKQSDLIIVATPHAEYRDLRPEVPTVDICNLQGQGVKI